MVTVLLIFTASGRPPSCLDTSERLILLVAAARAISARCLEPSVVWGKENVIPPTPLILLTSMYLDVDGRRRVS